MVGLGTMPGNLTPWLFPTSDFLAFDKGPGTGDNATGAVALPALTATSTVLQFTVPNGRNGRIAAIGINVVPNGGAAFVPGILPPQLAFSIAADQPPGAAAGTVPGAFPDYGMFNFLPGAVIQPTPVAGLMIFEGQLITVTVTNLTLAVTTQFVAARLLGYFFPKKRQPKDAGYQ